MFNLWPVHLFATILFLLENSKGNLLTWLAKILNMSSVFYIDSSSLVEPQKDTGIQIQYTPLHCELDIHSV